MRELSEWLPAQTAGHSTKDVVEDKVIFPELSSSSIGIWHDLDRCFAWFCDEARSNIATHIGNTPMLLPALQLPSVSAKVVAEAWFIRMLFIVVTSVKETTKRRHL